jgi:hypothetical protein
MARTRTSDPGRVAALHYAATPRQRHAKRLVYASFLLAGLVAGGWGTRLGAQEPNSPGVPCVACQALSVASDDVSQLPDRLSGTRMLLRVAPGMPAGEGTSAIEALRRRGAVPGLHLTGIPAEDDPLLAAGVDTFLFDVAAGDADRQAFDLKRALSLVRGRRPSAVLMIAASSGVSAALRERGLDSYADGFLPAARPIRSAEELLTPGSDLDFFARPQPSRSDPGVVWLLPAQTEVARQIATVAAQLQTWLPSGLVPVPGRALQCGGNRPLTTFLNPLTLDLVAVSRSSAPCPLPAIVTSDSPGVTAERYDVGLFDVVMASVFRVRVNGGDRFAAGVDVAAARSLAIDEIIARHQAAAARQAAEVRASIATGSFTLTFEAPGFVAPISITSQMTIYTGDGRTDLQQHEIRVNGVLFTARGGVPRLPIIEPERAAAPPLAITLSDVYRYRLAGRDTANGRDAYLVAFAPRDRRAPLYEGRAWIDVETFGMVRVSAAQTGLKGPITVSEQDDEFEWEDGRWRPARSNVRQNYEGAAVKTPIHRLLVIDRYEVNPSDFEARRAAAYASNDVMLRDTPEGYRYLKHESGLVRRSLGEGGKPEAGSEKPEASLSAEALAKADAARVIAGRADRIRTLAFGVIVDPNISVPLPFAGLSYVDFNLFGTGTQFSGFFGGSYGQVAFSAPSLGGTRWQLAGRAFGIASSYNDRAFERGLEQYTLDIRQRPAQAAVWLLRPLSARTALRLEYDWDYTKFGEGEVMDPAFVVPSNQNAHALRVGLDVQRAGWQASAWGSYARRIGWQPWGLPGAPGYEPGHADYTRYGASVLRSQALSPRVTTRIEAAVMAGRDLDRFSRFAFGTFDNRLRGYPSALVRYDRGGVVRTAVAWSVARALRLDFFADTAEVHDPGFGPGLRNYTGFGAAVESPAPFGTLVAVEWGYGVQGVNARGQQGTHVVRISGYKVF